MILYWFLTFRDVAIFVVANMHRRAIVQRLLVMAVADIVSA
jgi:hypothetical protein